MKDPERLPDTRVKGRAEGRGSKGAPSPAAFAGLGIQLVVSILLFVYAGRWLDEKLGTGPWLLVAGAFLGACAGFYAMYRSLMAVTRGEGRDAGSGEGKEGGGGSGG